MGILKHIAAMACMLIASTAQADWDHTHWGQPLQSLLDMDEYEVVETPEDEDHFGREIRKRQDISLLAFGLGIATAKTPGELEYWGASGIINFMFVSDSHEAAILSAIAIEVDDDWYPRLPMLLEDRYGVPAITPRERSLSGSGCDVRTMFWRDDASGNNIRLIDAFCRNERQNLTLLIYSPILTAENSPL